MAALHLTPAEPRKDSARPIRELNADELRFSSNLTGFTSTRDLTRATRSMYLAEVRNRVLNNLYDFKEAPATPFAMPFTPAPRERDPYLEYEVTIVVDNAQTSGAPIRRGHPRTVALLYPTQVEAAGTDPDEVVKKL